MKKLNLLLATTAMLSTTALVANAGVVNLLQKSGGNALTIYPSVDLVGTYSISSNSELRFGVVLGPEVDDTITIKADGTVYGDAKLLDQAVGANASNSNAITSKTVSAGSIKVTGAIDTLLTNTGVSSVHLVFPENAIELRADGGETLCGTIAPIPSINVTTAGDYAYGGTLTIKTTATGKHCVGNANVTLMMTEATGN